MRSTISTIIATLTAGMTTGHGAGSGTLTNGTGTATGSPVTLAAGANTVTVTIVGTLTIVLPTGQTGTCASGTCAVTSSPVSLVGGSNTITTSGAPGTITITLKASDDEYYIKTWYTGEPGAILSGELNAGAVIPAEPTSRQGVFVGEDTVTETVNCRFYTQAMRESGDATEVTAGYSRLAAIFEQAQVVLRTDPTFSSTFISSNIVGVTPMVQGSSDGQAIRGCEVKLQIIRRALWGA